MSENSLELQIRSLPLVSLRRNYAMALTDWADTDSAVRLAARRVLSEFEVEGDSYGVPAIEDIVETLVARIESSQRPAVPVSTICVDGVSPHE